MSNTRHTTALLLLIATGCPDDVGNFSITDEPATTQPGQVTTSGEEPTDGAATTISSSTSGDDPVDGATTSTTSTTSTDTSSAETSGSGTTAAPSTYSVTVVVSGLDDDSATLKLGDQEVAVMGDGAYVFPGELPDGAPYQVGFGSEPAHHECVLDAPGGVVQAMDVVIPAVCVKALQKDLLLAEIGLADNSQDSFWIELAHVGTDPVDLGEYSVRARTLDPLIKDSVETYALPSRMIMPGDRVLLRGALPDVVAGPGIVPISKSPKIRPFFVGHGAVELLKAEESRDYVAFGTIPPNKVAELAATTPAAWIGYPADVAPLPAMGATMRGKSIARDLALTDSNTSGDWTPVQFSTPGGLNDTHGCVADADADGLPDCSEVMGASYAGVDIHGLGARQGQRDIFVEIDYMDPKGKDGVSIDPGMVPHKLALEHVVKVFAAHDFHVHLDVGPLFDPAPGLNLASLDRGGGNQIEYAAHIYLGSDPASTSIHEIKAQHQAAQRLAMFHYAVFADQSLLMAGGQAERPGNDLYISLGSKQYSMADEVNVNRTYTHQAAVLMHELGHNLGLSHGGYSTYKGDALVDEANHKPNYLSVMNYMYSYIGLPMVGMSEGDRYYFKQAGCEAKGVTSSNMTPPGHGPLGSVILDFSSGEGATMDLAAVDEKKGLGREGSQWVDFDCDDVVDPPYAHGLHAAVDNNEQIEIKSVRDHDDWGGLDLYFLSSLKGFDNADVPATRGGDLRGPLVRAPIVNDVQPLDAPDPAPRARQDAGPLTTPSRHGR